MHAHSLHTRSRVRPQAKGKYGAVEDKGIYPEVS